MPLVTVQVFEHSTIQIGEPMRTVGGAAEHTLTAAEHAVLATFADSTRDRYFACGRRTVRFGSYVGLLQLGELVIEILPKADQDVPGGHDRWHRALVRMLRVVGDLGLEARDEAHLHLRPGRLFEIFIARFVDECERIAREGLAKGYRTEESNRPAFRGRLLVREHVRHNAVNAARFYVASPVYDPINIPNLALHEALRVVETLPLSPFTRSRARTVRHAFPELPTWDVDAHALERIRLTRKTARYRPALELARLILLHLAPNLRSGKTPLLALLFDMNLLWERYVATLAKRLRLPGIEVRTQDSKPFWRDATGGTRTLRPDITLRAVDTGEVVLLVDTKWKVPKDGRASSADLKQMFCYHELFGCGRSLLVYPASTSGSGLVEGGIYVGRAHRCAMGFLDVEEATNELHELMRAGMGADVAP